jgi:hypothetical protein
MTNMAKVKTSMIRALHAHLSQVLEDFDARNSGEAEGEDNAGNVASSKEIMKRDQPGAQDRPPPFEGQPKDPTAQDEAFNFDGEHVKIVRGSKALSKAVPGMDRLTAVNLDTRKRGLTAIQPSEGVRSIRALEEKFAADTKAASDKLFGK